MDIHEFAEKYRLKIGRDRGDGTVLIPGNHDQTSISEWSDTELAVMFITPASKPARPYFWRKHRDAGLAAGMRLIQNGDAEGVLGFDPTKPEQAKIALRPAGVKRKRQMTPKQTATLAQHQYAPRQTA
jgi:hypothetical protein